MSRLVATFCVLALAFAVPVFATAAAKPARLSVDVTGAAGARAFEQFLHAHNGQVVQLSVRCGYYDTLRTAAQRLPASTHCYAGQDKGKINWVVFSVFTGPVSAHAWWAHMLGQDVAGETWAGFPAAGRFVTRGTSIAAVGRFRVKVGAAGVGAGSDVSVALLPA
ncbi:MAG TPA: hypothetical protein VGL84_02720 [Gaiellaceae bacterium]